MPFGIDSVVLNNAGISSDALYADIDATVSSLEVVNSGNSATLAMTNDVTLSVLNQMTVGQPGQDGIGTVNQAAGTISVGGNLSINSNATSGVYGTYNLTGGTLNMAGTELNGGGLLKLQSGIFSAGENNSSPVEYLKAGVEISGGTFSWLSQLIMNPDAPRDFTVIGDEASITMLHLQFSGYTGAQGTLKWILDETGVSTINMNNWMFLDLAKIVVDGSAYTNGAQTIKLIDGVSINGLADTNNITVTGFSSAYVAEVSQDTVNGDIVLTINQTSGNPIGDITLDSLVGGDLVLLWDTFVGQTYNVETNADLMVPNWGILETIIGDGGTVSATNTPDQAQLFYKVTSP